MTCGVNSMIISKQGRLDPELLLQILRAKKEAVDRVVHELLPETHDIPEIDLLYKMMMDYPSRGGKGIRSAICLLTCQALGGKEQSAYLTAAAIEILQNWILIHDDIEDDSEMRRGDPVLHRRYGIPLAINAGDALHVKMWEILLRNEKILGKEITLAVLREFLQMTRETTEGQHLELSWVRNNRWDLRDEDYFLMCEKKTSWYTCISPMRLGGMIAGATEEILSPLFRLGRDLGIAFQIRDDILNLLGDEEKYGKETMGDLWEGKRTLLIIRLLNVMPEGAEREKILRIMNQQRGQKQNKDMNFILDSMKRLHVFDYGNSRADDLAKSAFTVFDKVFGSPSNNSANVALRSLLEFTVTRDW